MRVLVVSDVHANLPALDAVLAAAPPVDAIWHLGDVVGYGPDPDEVIERLRDVGAVGVRGNHDAAAVGGDEIEWFNPDARRAMEWTRERIGPATLAWLRALPTVLTIGDFTLVHGSPRDPLWEYVLSRDVAEANLAVLTTPYGLHGHTHMPIVWRVLHHRVQGREGEAGTSVELGGAPSLLNPGSVGQPRDGIPTSSFLILDTVAATATWQRVAYDVGTVQERMRAVALPKRLIDRLTFGI